MSFTLFKEVNISNPGSETRYGADDLLDFYKILNAKTTSTRRPEIINRWRWSAYQELKATTAASVPTPSESDVAHFFLDTSDTKLKLKKTGGTLINLEDVGAGAWNPTSTETLQNKTINFDLNTVKHSTTNATGDLIRYDGTRYSRIAKGTALQILAVNSAGTDLEWQTPAGGGGGSGEANTASNVGTQGIGIFYQKLGVDLQFKSIFSPDGSVLISDDTGNQKIDLSLGSGFVRLNQSNTYGDFQQTFRSARLCITNPANSFGFFFIGTAITASRNITLPLLTANDIMVTEGFTQTLTNKTLGSGTTANLDAIILKHSTTNTVGDIVYNTGTKYDRFPRGNANQQLMMDGAGTNLTWGTVSGGGVKLPDGSIAPSTGRWGAFYGGSGDGFGMMGFISLYGRIHGSANSSTESATEIYTSAGIGATAEFKTGCGFRRDSTSVFKTKFRLTSTAACKVHVGLSDAQIFPSGTPGGGTTGTPTIRYNVSQSSSGHTEFDSISRAAVRFGGSAPGLGQSVTEVIVRFRKFGTPSGNATVGIRKGTDNSLVATLGTFQPNSFGTGEQSVTIGASLNTYLMVSGDRVSVEFPASSTDGLELDQDDAGPPSGFTCEVWSGSSWGSMSEGIGLRISTSVVTAGTSGSGDTPLNGVNGIMVHGTIGTHTNYQIARNNGAATQTTADSGKALANLTDHTLDININSTNVIVTIDGTPSTYTTVIPATTTPMAWWFHIEAAAAAEKGLGIVYAQVVTTA